MWLSGIQHQAPRCGLGTLLGGVSFFHWGKDRTQDRTHYQVTVLISGLSCPPILGSANAAGTRGLTCENPELVDARGDIRGGVGGRLPPRTPTAASPEQSCQSTRLETPSTPTYLAPIWGSWLCPQGPPNACDRHMSDSCDGSLMVPLSP